MKNKFEDEICNMIQEIDNSDPVNRIVNVKNHIHDKIAELFSIQVDDIKSNINILAIAKEILIKKMKDDDHIDIKTIVSIIEMISSMNTNSANPIFNLLKPSNGSANNLLESFSFNINNDKNFLADEKIGNIYMDLNSDQITSLKKVTDAMENFVIEKENEDEENVE